MKEIGSDFNIPFSLLRGDAKNSLADEEPLFSTGRDCIEYIIQELELRSGEVVLLPSYLCPEMLVPFQNHNLNLRFYKIGIDLKISPQDFRGEIEKGDVKLALIINYFGFPDPGRQEIKNLCDQYRVTLVEDYAQAMLSDIPSIGSVCFTSFRKSIPVPDGAMIEGLSWLTPFNSQTSFARVRFRAGVLKNFKFLKFIWRPMFVKAETELCNHYDRPASMSEQSKNILSRIDLNDVANKRRTNFESLAIKIKNASGIKLVYNPSLPEGIVPLFLPVCCKDRGALREHLRKNKVYCPVHWSLPQSIDETLFPVSEELSRTLLSIPIDQRYDEKDMERIAKVIYEVCYD
jgi:dTDP-4-amino-4,6-dideoxygalactose transaminase